MWSMLIILVIALLICNTLQINVASDQVYDTEPSYYKVYGSEYENENEHDDGYYYDNWNEYDYDGYDYHRSSDGN